MTEPESSFSSEADWYAPIQSADEVEQTTEAIDGSVVDEAEVQLAERKAKISPAVAEALRERIGGPNGGY